MHLDGSPPVEVPWSITQEQFQKIVRGMQMEIQRLKDLLARKDIDEEMEVLKGALPCPFCGKPPLKIESQMTGAGGFDSGWGVLCDNEGCGACGPVKRRGKKTALDAWNKRLSPK